MEQTTQHERVDARDIRVGDRVARARTHTFQEVAATRVGQKSVRLLDADGRTIAVPHLDQRWWREVRGGYATLVRAAERQREVDAEDEAWLTDQRAAADAIASEAIDLFVTVVTEEVPWTGLADISPATRERFKQAALRGLREDSRAVA